MENKYFSSSLEEKKFGEDKGLKVLEKICDEKMKKGQDSAPDKSICMISYIVYSLLKHIYNVLGVNLKFVLEFDF